MTDALTNLDRLAEMWADLDPVDDWRPHIRDAIEEIERLRAALTAPPKVSYLLAGVSGEPVLFIHPDTLAMDNAHVGAWKPGHELPGYIPLYTAQPAPAPECDSPKLCAVNGACAGQYGTKKQCATAQPAPARVPLTEQQVWDNDAIMSRNAVGGLPMHDLMRLVRVIEAAHGIAPDAQQEPMP